MANLTFDSPAEDDIESIAHYIGVANHSPEAARKLIDDIYGKCESYARQPLMGDIVPELGDDVRCFPVRRNYVVLYRPLEDGALILRVFHTARDWVNALLSDEP